MPNSNNSEPEISGCIERVVAKESRRENVLVLCAMFAILIVSCGLLFFRSESRSHQTKIPASLSNMVTQLSSASIELIMLTELGVLPELPSLDALIQHDILPFSQQAFTEVSPTCFMMTLSPHLLRYTKLEDFEGENPWQIAWRLDYDANDPRHHDALNNEECLEKSTWNIVNY